MFWKSTKYPNAAMVDWSVEWSDESYRAKSPTLIFNGEGYEVQTNTKRKTTGVVNSQSEKTLAASLIDAIAQTRRFDRDAPPSLSLSSTRWPLTLGSTQAIPTDDAPPHFWSVVDTTGSPLSLTDISIGTLRIAVGSAKSVLVERCKIGRVHVVGSKLALQITNSSVGSLDLSPASLQHLDVENSDILALDISPTENPFTGDVRFEHVRFGTDVDYKLLSGPQCYTSLREHLESLGNSQAAHIVRAAEMATERHTDLGVNLWINRLYGWASDWGTAPGRTLGWLGMLYVLSFVVLWIAGSEVVAQYGGAYSGWRDELRPRFTSEMSAGVLSSSCELKSDGRECWGSRFKRTAVLAGQGMLTPITIFSQPVVIAANSWGQLWILFESVVSLTLWLIFGVSIRRRFKIGT